MAIGPTAASIFRDHRRLLSLIALLLALDELKDTFFISFWPGALVFAILFLAGTLWIRRGGIGGPILVAALCAFELLAFPSWQRTTTYDWINEITAVVVALAGLLVAIAVIKHSFDTRETKTTTARIDA